MRENYNSLLSFIGSGLLWLGLSGAAAIAFAQNAPSDFRSNHELGEYYAHRGDYQSAVRYLESAYKLNPADVSNAYDLAQAELQLGDAAGARSLLETLLSRADRPDLHNLLGDCEEALGNFRQAAAQYQIAARADPSESNLFSFGSELLKHGAYREALQILSYAEQHYPQSARLRVALGIGQYSLGQYRDTVATLCSAVDLDPSDPRPFEFLGKMVGVAPELSNEVTGRLKHFAATYPANASANYYYALCLLAEPGHSRDLARPLLERAVAESPSFAEAHYQLGIVYEEEGDTPRGIAELQKAIRLKPDWKSAHYHLAQLYRKAGRRELAESEFQAVRNARAR